MLMQDALAHTCTHAFPSHTVAMTRKTKAVLFCRNTPLCHPQRAGVLPSPLAVQPGSSAQRSTTPAQCVHEHHANTHETAHAEKATMACTT